MAAPGPYSNYKTNVGRSVTKKWRDANLISYDGGDWGEDDDDDYEPAPVSADNPRHPAWDRQSNRSFTNPNPPPAPSQGYNRPSFDRGDEKRHISSGAGFDSAYPSTQRDPFPEPQHDFDPPPGLRDQLPLRLNTQAQVPPNTFRPGSRGRQYPPYNDAPFSAPGIFPQQQRRSGSSGRPTPGEVFQRHESPMRPDSRGSTASARQFPPRKASLSQQPPDFTRGNNDLITSSPISTGPNTNERPIPTFVRPSDIYKRVPEEMEKARKSQDSSRPSIDSGTVRGRADSVDGRSISSESKDVPTLPQQPAEDTESIRRLKPTLDPVPERKSEYGLDNLANEPLSQVPVGAEDKHKQTESATVTRHPTNASSVYTDRPDPVSASSISRNQSMHEDIPEPPSASRLSYGLPSIGRMSSFGMDLGPLGLSGSEPSREVPPSPALPPPPVPAKDSSIVERSTLESKPQNLHHQPSLGYRSMVQQAFDDSEKETPFSPISTSGSVYRSNSNSTSDISPIISHKQSGPLGAVAQNAYPVIPEEPPQSSLGPNTADTLRQVTSLQPKASALPPPPIRPGYRRENTPPSQDNNPAKQPVSIAPFAPREPEQGSVIDEAPAIPAKDEKVSDELSTISPSASKALPPVPEPPAENPPSTERTTSEEWKEWQAQRKQFNAQAGIQDSGVSTPYAPSPIARSESPAKSTVRDIAEKLESNSGRSTPSNVNVAGPSPTSATAENARPVQQTRLESFRPAIPGGWQSYTSTAASGSSALNSPLQQPLHAPPPPPRESTETAENIHVFSAPAVPNTQSSVARTYEQPSERMTRPSTIADHRSETTESIPTARAPTHPEEDGITKKAFAAAATAGSALANAFTGQPASDPAPKSPTRSEVSSENEWDASSDDSEDEPVQSGPARGSHPSEPTRTVTPPVGNRSLEQSASIAASTPSSIATTSESDVPRSDPQDYPAPLRTSRIMESSPILRPPIPHVALSHDSADEDNDRLQHEIVKSLTPKSSTIEGEADDSGAEQTAQPPLTESRDLPSSQPTAVQSSTSSNVNRTGNSPTYSHSPVNSNNPPAPSTPGRDSDSVPRPQLQHRFSWETGSDQTQSMATPKQTSPPATNSPDTIRELAQPASTVLESSGRNQGSEQPTTTPQMSDTVLAEEKQPQRLAAVSQSSALGQTTGSWQSPPQRAPPEPTVTTPGQSTGLQDSPAQGKFAGPQQQAQRESTGLQKPTAQGQLKDPAQQIQKQSAGSQQPPSQIPPAGQPQAQRQSTGPHPLPAQSQQVQQSYQSQPAVHQQTSQTQSSVSQRQSDGFSRPSPELPQWLQQATTNMSSTPALSKVGTNEFRAPPAQRQQTVDPVSFRSIMALGSPQERIAAFNESRKAHSISDGQLEVWLSSLNTDEHAEIFALNGRVSQDVADLTPAHKPSPRRLLTESVGSRHIQEDGKKLMAKAGRFGGKAGIAAKGLFAKGKEKIRTASSGGDKGRRKSTGLSSTDSNEVLPEAQPQSRDSTLLDGPPQIPFTLSPATPLESSDWFAKSDFGQSARDDLQRPQVVPSSNTSFTQETHDQARRHHDHPVTSDAAKATPTPASPAISALEDDHDDQAAVPSRSISQLTRPTEESPVESPHRATAERSLEREIHPLRSHQDLDVPDSKVANIGAPGPFLGHAHGSRSDVNSSDRSLQVPDERRRSLVSDVSSASPSPGPVASGKQIRRSVSPADELSDSQKPYEVGKPAQGSVMADNQLPGYDQVVPDAVVLPPEKSAPEEPPPGIDEPYIRQDVDLGPPVSPPDIEPQSRPTQPVNQYYGPSDIRPYSFVGGEYIGQVHQTQDGDSIDLTKTSTQPLSPVSQTLSKDMSQVSIDEVSDGAPGQRQSRSYSRPFAADPNVRNHPAFKTAEPEQAPIDRAQMYSSESPLPSARRPLNEVDRLRQQKEEQQSSVQAQQDEDESDGKYRIPGPYIQNYRSPKQITTPRIGRSETQVQASGQPLPSALRSQQQQYQQQPQPQPQEQIQQQQQQQPLPQQQQPPYQGYQHQQYQQYQQYQAQQQTSAQAPTQPPSAQQSTRKSYTPELQQGYQNQASYGAEPPSQYPNNPENPANRLSQQPDQFAPQQRQSMGPPPIPEAQAQASAPSTGRKKSTFGSLFGTSSKSRSKLQKSEQPPSIMEAQVGQQQRDKRSSIFRRNSRHDSISSQQSGQHGGQDQVGQLPSANIPTHSARRHSRDILRAPSTEPKEQPAEKKKRFSGFGNLFKSSSTSTASRSSTTPAPASHQTGPPAEQQYQRQYSAQNFMSPQSYSGQNAYGQFPSGGWAPHQQQQPNQAQAATPGQLQRGYSHPSQQAQGAYSHVSSQSPPPPQSAYPHVPQQGPPSQQPQFGYSDVPGRQQQNQYPAVVSPFQYQSGTGVDPYGTMQQPQVPPTIAPQQTLHASNTYPYINPDQRRPSDLRIDTSNPGRTSAHNVPATAPAQIYPPRESSFSPPAARPYGSPSPGITTTTAPSHSPSSTRQQQQPDAVRNHVIDLHKRSRSPKLGRRSSSEDFEAQQRQAQQGGRPSNGLTPSGLGTFSSKRISPVGGIPRPESDQERPYAIGLPPGLAEEDEDQSGKSTRGGTGATSPPAQARHSAALASAVVGARSDTPVSLDSHHDVSGGTGTLQRAVLTGTTDGLVSRSGTSAAGAGQNSRGNARDKSSPSGNVVELPGSKPDGYESEEEVLMSATAYPGQEWMPVFVGDDGRWDD